MRGYDLKKVPLLFANLRLLPFKHNLVETLGFAKLFCKMASNLSDSVTKVHQAARDGTADLTDHLKRLNTDERKTALETKTKDGDQITTPLIIAAHNGNLESVKILLGYKADIEARGTLKLRDGEVVEVVEGCTPLWAAAASGHLDVVKLLLERNADVDSRTLKDSTPLRAAAYVGRLDIVSYLVENGAAVNARNEYGNTPLMTTCCNGHMNVATYLVEHGANIHLQDKNGYTCLHYAAETGQVEVVSKLLAVGAKENPDYVNARNNFGTTPLMRTCYDGHVNVATYLVEHGANIHLQDKNGYTCLHYAAETGQVEVVSKLLAVGAKENQDYVNARNNFGSTPLMRTCYNGHVNVATYLVEHGANIHLQDEDGNTCLHFAAKTGHVEVVSKLLAVGAKENQDYVNARNNFRSTPLMRTCSNGHMNVATYLVEHGANIHLQNKDGDTCLHCAAERGHVEVVSKLLGLGAKEKQNYKRLTPLLVASNHYKIEMVEYFIKRPECTKEQRIDAIELLGATIANDPDGYDIEKALSYMKRGMEERYEDPSHPLLKEKMGPVEAYQNRKESQTLEELALLEGDDHAIHMEGLIIRERILGTDNTELLFDIRYRGHVFAASDQYDLCFGLWRRSMEIAVNCDDPLTKDLDNFAHVFGLMVQKGGLLRPKCIEDVFEKLVTACERLTEKSKSGKLQEEHKNEEEAKMLFYALYLLMIYTKVQVPNKNGTVDMTDFVQRFLRLNPRTQNGNTLLHLAAWHETPITLEDDVRSVYKLPCVETMKLILHAGCDVNAVNTEGNTPLHLAVTFKPGPGQVDILKEMLELLLDVGADTRLANTNGQTAVDYCKTEDARRILSEKTRLDATNVGIKTVRKF